MFIIKHSECSWCFVGMSCVLQITAVKRINWATFTIERYHKMKKMKLAEIRSDRLAVVVRNSLGPDLERREKSFCPKNALFVARACCRTSNRGYGLLDADRKFRQRRKNKRLRYPNNGVKKRAANKSHNPQATEKNRNLYECVSCYGAITAQLKLAVREGELYFSYGLRVQLCACACIPFFLFILIQTSERTMYTCRIRVFVTVMLAMLYRFMSACYNWNIVDKFTRKKKIVWLDL